MKRIAEDKKLCEFALLMLKRLDLKCVVASIRTIGNIIAVSEHPEDEGKEDIVKNFIENGLLEAV